MAESHIRHTHTTGRLNEILGRDGIRTLKAVEDNISPL
jgi:hypothetical protein